MIMRRTCTLSLGSINSPETPQGCTRGIAQQVPDGDRDTTCATVTDFDTAPIHRRSVLGGLVNE